MKKLILSMVVASGLIGGNVYAGCGTHIPFCQRDNTPFCVEGGVYSRWQCMPSPTVLADRIEALNRRIIELEARLLVLETR